MVAGAVLFLAAVSAAAQSVEGTVRNAVTGSPVAGAKVVLQQNGIAAYYCETDGDGHCRIEDVPDGTYTAAFSAERYGNSIGPRATPEIKVAAGGAPVRVEGQLMPFRRIRGRVVDGRGDPVPDAHLELTGSSVIQHSQTGRDGKFALVVIPEHRNLTLAVSPPAGWKAPERDKETGEARAWARTFYPGVALRDLAAPIVPPLDADMDGIQIKLLAVALHPVRGVLLHPDGSPAARVTVGVTERSAIEPPVHQAESKADGTFEFAAIPEGEWLLSAETGVEGVTLQASQWIEVTAHPIDGLKLRLSPPITVRGRAIFETRQGMPAPDPPQLRLNERHAGQAAFLGTSRTARADADGNFQFQDFYPGTYAFNAGPAPPLFYLEAIRLGDVPVVGEIELSAALPPLTVVYKSDGGAVRGTVENCNSGMVLLVPQDHPELPVFTGSCGSDNRFTIDTVRPGDYSALVLAGRRRWMGDVDPALLPTASRVTVRSGETTQADLRAQ